jgi:hypothetical protein
VLRKRIQPKKISSGTIARLLLHDRRTIRQITPQRFVHLTKFL